MNVQNKAIILCADDFSLNPAVSAAILHLLQLGRLSALGCLTQSPQWQADARCLLPWQDHVDIGLHFNLTENFPAAYRVPLPQLMLQSRCGLLARQHIHRSLCQQLDVFEQTLGRAPDFIDGHQHVHSFPGIRDILLEEYQRRYTGPPHTRPYIRALTAQTLAGMPNIQGGLKACVLQVMGAASHTRLLRQQHIPHNPAFAGLYHFKADGRFPQRLSTWLQALPAGGLIVCHPATAAISSDDPLAATRAAEYAYLSGPRWPQALTHHHCQLARFYL